LKYALEQRWEDKAANQFPMNKGNYVESYKKLEEYMNTNCHPNVTIGAALNEDGLLTDHGVEHVQMVIHNAFQILSINNKIGELVGYEIYILLLAIHFHDIGNISGRTEHEKRIAEIMDIMGANIPLDRAERIVVSNIATTHGGFVCHSDSDKDTLCSLDINETCNGIPIRPALLAAIVRMADELSDDETRANRFLDETDNIPACNRIFHEYSKSLSPISITGNVVEFKFYIAHEIAFNKVPDEDGEYLYDEILNRLKKCMCELEYCRKYSQGFIGITSLSIVLNVLQKDSGFRPEKTTKFNLRLSGYPQKDNIEFKLLEFENGSKLRDALASGKGLQPIC